jgi:transcriptional regulator with XRE-family HTH domain
MVRAGAIETMATKTTKRGDADSLGVRLRGRRRELGLTQEPMAEKAETTQAVIKIIENGKSSRPLKLDQIALALGVKAAWLMFGSNRFDELDRDAAMVATAWSRLAEPARSSLRKEILRHGG